MNRKLFVVISIILIVLRGSSFTARALPSYARQTGLPGNGCHYAPPELNPAGRAFKLLGYIDRNKEFQRRGTPVR
jgi:hypothetical protein